MGNNDDLLAKKLNGADAARRWKVVEVENPTDGFRYKIAGRRG
jgi:hypothetical protein